MGSVRLGDCSRVIQPATQGIALYLATREDILQEEVHAWAGSLFRRHEPLQLLDPVLDDDDLSGSGGLVSCAAAFFDHQKVPAVWRNIVGAAQECSAAAVILRLKEDHGRAAAERGAQRLAAGFDWRSHERPIGRAVEQLSPTASPSGCLPPPVDICHRPVSMFGNGRT